jgi:peptidoglycan-N-acetylglucosamine deacetylase
MQIKYIFLLSLSGLLFSMAGCRRPLEPFNRAPAPGETAYFVPNDRKMIALTFDDGPNGAATEQILNVLKERHVPATFFLIGKNAERYPAIARRIPAEGHVIGNHTYQHLRFDQVPAAEMEKDIADGNKTLETLTGCKPAWFRPPYGINGVGLADMCRRRGLAIVGWSLDANDWNPHPVAELVDAITNQVTAGDIILLHDGWETRENPDRQATVAAVPLIVDKLKAAGFVFVTLPELLRNAGAPVAVFENGVRLLGAQISAKPLHPGERFGVRYFWDVPEICAINPPQAFVHFLDGRGKIIFQDDHALPPRGDVRDRVVRNLLYVPKNALAGKCDIAVGLFSPAMPQPENRLEARSDFPQAQRAVYLPLGLKIMPAPAK